MNSTLLACIKCQSTEFEILEQHIYKTNDGKNEITYGLWTKCKNCGKESPVTQDEVKVAKELLKQQKK